MNFVNLSATKREEKMGKGALDKQRKAGFIPAIVYGTEVGTVQITVTKKELQGVLNESGINSIIKLNIAGSKTVSVMIKDIQTHPITGHYWHIDFSEITMGKPIHTEVHVGFEGEPAGVQKGGIIQHGETSVEVQCLPSEIPERIVLDISNLDIGDKLTVADLKLGDKVEIHSEPEQVLVSVVAPRLEADDTEDIDESAETAGEATNGNKE